MGKTINVIRGGKKILAEEFGCRHEHVSDCLNGTVNSMLSKKIRKRAKELDLIEDK